LKFHGTPNGGFATVSISKAGMVVTHLDGAGKVLYTAPAIPPRGSAPAPAPTPTPPSGTWECHSKKVSKVGKDTNLKGTGADISSCQQSCDNTDDCTAIYWHKTDSHCHVLTGSFSYEDWSAALKGDSERDSCFRKSAAMLV
jgi:hypothetical protein